MAATTSAYFNSAGQLTWAQDALGRIGYYAYDTVTGLRTQAIADVDANQGLTAPTGWTLPTDGQHVATDYAYDSAGNLTQVLGAVHNVDGVDVRTALWIVTLAYAREVRTAAGYATESTAGSSVWDTFTLSNPVSISKFDRNGRVSEDIQATRGSGVTDSGKLSASDVFATSSYTSRTAYLYDTAGQLIKVRSYVDATGDSFSQTEYCFDSMGRRSGKLTPSGNVTRYLYNARGLLQSEWLGTDDTPYSGEWSPTNRSGTDMEMTVSYEYDNGNDMGDGNLTQTTEYVDNVAANNRVTGYVYDWRNRLYAVVAPADAEGRVTYTTYEYNNLGEVLRTRSYYDDDNDLSTAGFETYINGAAAEDLLLSQTEWAYDSLGQVYHFTTYAIAEVVEESVTYNRPTESLTASYWYDAASRLVKSQGAGTEEFTKFQYDGLGQLVAEYGGYDTSASEDAYSAVGNVTGDTIFAQREYTYNAAGELIKTIARDRYHDDATSTGALGSGNSLAYTVGYWYDAVGRLVATADYGSAALDRAAQASAPTRSDTVLVASTQVNARGEVRSTFDQYGRETRFTYDDSGSLVAMIKNYVDGDASTGNADEDIITQYGYGAGRLLDTLTVTSQKADGTGVDVQTTRYVYGTDVDDYSPLVYRNDLVRAVIYSDSDDTFDSYSLYMGNGNDSTYDRVEYKYNRLGELIQVTDQNGTTHAYEYDNLGRRTSDRVTTLAWGVDGATRRVDIDYTVRGQVESITSYDNPAPGAGNVVNQVVYVYTAWGLLAREYQEHEGAVDQDTLYVEYAYAGVEHGLRLESVRYPNGRLVHYTYGAAGGADDNLNRLAAVRADDNGNPGQVLAAYTYLGRGTIVKEDYAEAQVRLDYTGANPGEYDGFDQFRRVVDHLWEDYGGQTNVPIEEYLYGYNRLGTPTWKENAVAAAEGVHLDELYAHDDLYRLIGVARGDLNSTRSALESGTSNLSQTWDLSGLGVWATYAVDSDGDGTADLEQTRQSNAMGEVTDVGEQSGQTQWVTPAYDRAGNMTTLPKPSDRTVALTAVYDAWNRLVRVSEGAYVIASYEYDGLGRLVVQASDASAPDNPDGTLDTYTHHFHAGVQLVETRDATTANAQAETLQAHYTASFGE